MCFISHFKPFYGLLIWFACSCIAWLAIVEFWGKSQMDKKMPDMDIDLFGAVKKF